MRYLTLVRLRASPGLAADRPGEEGPKDFPPIPTVDLKRKDPVEYDKDIEPIFENKCFVCHTGSVTEGKFDMGTYAGVHEGRQARHGRRARQVGREQPVPVLQPAEEADHAAQDARSRSTRRSWRSSSCGSTRARRPRRRPAMKDEGRRQPAAGAGQAGAGGRRQPRTARPSPPAAATRSTLRAKTTAEQEGRRQERLGVREDADRPAAEDARRQGREGRPHVARRVDGVQPGRQDARHRQLPGTHALGRGEGRRRSSASAASPTASTRIALLARRQAASPPAAARRPRTARSRSSTPRPASCVTEIKNGHSDTVFGVAFSPDGKLLATVRRRTSS